MAGETSIVVVGRMTAAPELRFTPGGHAVANFTIASSPRVFDKASGQWQDGDALFMRCSAWRDLAENVTESFDKGMGVIAQGNLKQRSYETKEGEKRTVIELDVQAIGPDLRWATAQVTRPQRQQQRPQQPAQQQGGWSGQGQPAPDPWAAAPAGGEPPF